MGTWNHRFAALLVVLVAALLGQGCGVAGVAGEQQQELRKDLVKAPSQRPAVLDFYKLLPSTPKFDTRLDPRTVQLAKPQGLVAHEWGTFTSVQSSDGTLLEGLHHEEEPLPDFVFKRSRANYGKGMEMPTQVTQKLETPVIYFYTKKQMKVSVEVDFPKGILSEWFPNAISFAPAINHNVQQSRGLTVPKDGTMRWDVELVPGLKTAPPAVSPDDVWAPSRQVPAATPLRFVDTNPRRNGAYAKKPLKTQVEKFIFYRGLGKFDAWFRVKAKDERTLELHNQSKSVVPSVILLRVVGDKGGVSVVRGQMTPNEKRLATAPDAKLSMDSYVDTATKIVAAALIQAGLYKDEAWAMVNTWRHSYFKSQTPGIRVLYIVPRKDTDALLPIRISPKPTALVRVLVGRVEVLTPKAERDTYEHLYKAYKNRQSPSLDLYGRFGEPRLRNACRQIQNDPGFQKYCDNLIQQHEFKQMYNRQRTTW